jgi:hypothetical protein
MNVRTLVPLYWSDKHLKALTNTWPEEVRACLHACRSYLANCSSELCVLDKRFGERWNTHLAVWRLNESNFLFNCDLLPKERWFLEGSHILLSFSYDQHVDEDKCVDHCWKEIDGGKQKYSGKNLSRCLFVYHTYKTKINLNYISKFSSYRAVNTLRLGYKNQSVNAV